MENYSPRFWGATFNKMVKVHATQNKVKINLAPGQIKFFERGWDSFTGRNWW